MRPRISEHFAKGFQMLGADGDTPAARISTPHELVRLAGIPVATHHSLQLPPLVHEALRLFSAHHSGCTYCQNARQAIAVQDGLTEDIVTQLQDFHKSNLPEKLKAALRIMELFTTAPAAIDDDVLDFARQYYSEQEVIDIILYCTFSKQSRVAVLLGVEPGKENSSRLFYPTDPVYGSDATLSEAIAQLAAEGKVIKETGDGPDPIGTTFESQQNPS